MRGLAGDGAERVEHEPREARREDGIPLRDGVHGPAHFAPRRALRDVAAGARADDAHDVLRRVRDAQREEAAARRRRGRTAQDWSDHGADVAGAEEMWLAIIGPDTPALGERTSGRPVIQSQIASTLAAFLGIDYRGEMRRPAPAIGDVIR